MGEGKAFLHNHGSFYLRGNAGGAKVSTVGGNTKQHTADREDVGDEGPRVATTRPSSIGAAC